VEPSAGPLHGTRVIDLSRWIAGPFCTAILGDLGADVVRVERPGGEESRRLEPMLADDSAYAAHYGRNKRAIELDTRSIEGREQLLALLAAADVLVENYRPGTLDSMGLDAATLEALNPGLIVVHVSGYGQSGPMSRQPLFNAIAEATSGLMSVSRGETPTMSGNFSVDHTAGLLALAGALAALVERERSGRGQHVDVSLFDAAYSVLGFGVTAALNGVATEPVMGNRDATAAPGDLFATGDGRDVYIDAGTDGLFAALAAAIDEGRADAIAADPRFRTVVDRNAHVDALERLIGEWTGAHDAVDIADALERAGVPHGIVATIDEVIDTPVVHERGLIATFPADGVRAPLRVPGAPITLSRTPATVRRRPPAVGEHTEEVLAELGMRGHGGPTERDDHAG